jgi:hypothetical protein
MMTRSFSRRKRATFAIVTVLLSLVVTVGALGVLDEMLRRRYARSFGLNQWGYRGPVVGAKQPGERRVVLLGGSTAFGFGRPPSDSIAAELERRLDARRPGTDVSVVNLGYPKESAWSFHSTLTDYAYLDYDVAILYEGYNDLRRPHTRAFRQDSPMFRLTGYLPFLALVLAEKSRAIRYGGDLDERFGREDPVFRPSLADKAAAGALQAAAEVTRSLELVLGPLTRGPATAASVPGRPTCGERFRHYCEGVGRGVDTALAHDASVLVVAQPYISDTHVEQQRNVAAFLRARFGGDPRVVYLDLGSAVDLRDHALAFDGMHLTSTGNAVVAGGLVTPVLTLLEAR